MWAQKARTKWFLHGDRNTRYFQTVVRQRRSRNRILQIKDEHRHYIDVHEEIEQIFIDSFQRNFSCNSILTVESIIQEIRGLSIPSLTDQQVLLLNRGISIFEIEEAVFQIGPHKAPGPDGIPGFFFQNFWSIIKTDVCNAIQAFFHSGSLLKLLIILSLLPSLNFLTLKKCPILGLSVYAMCFTKLFQRFL